MWKFPKPLYIRLQFRKARLGLSIFALKVGALTFKAIAHGLRALDKVLNKARHNPSHY